MAERLRTETLLRWTHELGSDTQLQSSTNDKNLDLSKFKAFAVHKIIVNRMLEFLFGPKKK